MKIEDNAVVCFSYTLRDKGGIVLEQSAAGRSEVYLHGVGGFLPALEAALAGKTAGDKIRAELSAEDAYGARNEDNIQRVSVKHLQPAHGKLRVGNIAHVQTDHGWRQVRVLKLGKFQATVDANHPLAGLDVVFDIEVTTVRAATAEELTHGHAHGADGEAGHH